MNLRTVHDNVKQNDGECVQDGKEYSCLCKGKYRGRNCSEGWNNILYLIGSVVERVKNILLTSQPGMNEKIVYVH